MMMENFTCFVHFSTYALSQMNTHTFLCYLSAFFLSQGGCGNEDLVAAFVSSTVALLPSVSNAGNDQDINDTQKCGQMSFLPTEVASKKPCDLDADVSVVHTIPHYFQLGELKAVSADMEESGDLVNHSRVVSYDLQVPVDHAHLLLSAFCQAKRNKLGKGFLV